jgi:hypothetical protein
MMSLLLGVGRRCLLARKLLARGVPLLVADRVLEPAGVSLGICAGRCVSGAPSLPLSLSPPSLPLVSLPILHVRSTASARGGCCGFGMRGRSSKKSRVHRACVTCETTPASTSPTSRPSKESSENKGRGGGDAERSGFDSTQRFKTLMPRDAEGGVCALREWLCRRLAGYSHILPCSPGCGRASQTTFFPGKDAERARNFVAGKTGQNWSNLSLLGRRSGFQKLCRGWTWAAGSGSCSSSASHC